MKTILVFAPHPDDEILGCGGYLALMQAAGHRIRVVIVTDGARGLPAGRDSEVRCRECLAGLMILGITHVEFWEQPDGNVPLSGSIVDDCRQLVREMKPSEILLPAPGDSHRDHRRVTRLILKTLESHWQGKLLFYETVHPAPVINFYQDITATMPLKLQALKSHASQLKQFDYEENCQALARLRGLASGSKYAEGFLSFSWDGSPQNFFETFPLISVIVRAANMDLLSHALASLQTQEYDYIEVVLVWFGPGEPDLMLFHDLDIRVVRGKKNRAANLNLGLSQARGDYLAFLDEDDILYPHHFVTLLTEINGVAGVDIVYGGAKLVACHYENGLVEVKREVMEISSEPRATVRFLIGNHIPIHAALYRAPIFRNHRYLESLEVYEDWQMIGVLYLEGFSFKAVEVVTCEYRLYGVEGTGPEVLSLLHREKGYIDWRPKILAQFRERLQVKHLEELAVLVTGQEDEIVDLQKKVQARDGQISSLTNELQESRALEALLAEGLDACGIAETGRVGVASWLGQSMAGETLFSIVLPIHNTPADMLSVTLLSVANQAFPAWELCLVDDASSTQDTIELLSNLQKAPEFENRLFLSRRSSQGGIVAATMDAVAMGKAPYIVFLDHDDLLHQETLLRLALALRRNKKYGLLYSDSRMIDLAGEPLHIQNKQDWAPETLIHLNYINHLTVVKRTLFHEVGGLRTEYEGAQDWDLLLRLSRVLTPEQVCHISIPLYDWRATEQSVAYDSSGKPWAFPAAMRAVNDHLLSQGLAKPEVRANPVGSGVVCQWQYDPLPVEVIILTHNNVAGLKKCLAGVLEETDYPQLSVTIVANRCSVPEMLDFLAEKTKEGRVKIIDNNRPFNWSLLNNQAIAESQAPLLLLLNDDVEVLEKNWLINLGRYLQLSGVGAVGAVLRYPDGSLQHNGVVTDYVLGIRNIKSRGTRNELSMSRNVSAVTGACMMLNRELVLQAGGLDERLVVNFGDVDLCLALRKMGLRIVLAAEVVLIHYEHMSRGTLDSQEKKNELLQAVNFMKEKWGEQLVENYFSSYDILAGATKILKIGGDNVDK